MEPERCKSPGKSIPLAKMHGAGNDFIVFAEPLSSSSSKSKLAVAVCDRRRGLGADGAVFLKANQNEPLEVSFYNCDGGLAGMCFNGARCAAVRAKQLGLLSGSTGQMRTAMGIIDFDIAYGSVELRLPRPSVTAKVLQLDEIPAVDKAYFVPIADPHLVLKLTHKNFETLDFLTLARGLRWRLDLFTSGANVHAITQTGARCFRIRSFERGVEAETLSCGSGCIATTLALDIVDATFETAGGDSLFVEKCGPNFLSLKGPAELIAECEFIEPKTFLIQEQIMQPSRRAVE